MTTCDQTLLVVRNVTSEYALVRHTTAAAIVVTIGTGVINTVLLSQLNLSLLFPVPDTVANCHQMGLEEFVVFFLPIKFDRVQVKTKRSGHH